MNIPDFQLNNQIALITGARRGIGKTIALTFAAAGADVAICDVVTDDGLLEGTAEEIRKLGRRTLTLQADTSKKADIDRMVKQIVEKFGAINILVNNAAIDIPGPFLEIKEESWDKVMSIDLKGYFMVSQAVAKVMVQQKNGVIINIASQYAFRTDLTMGLYSIAKAGVAMLTRVLARELGSYGIRANALAPGLIKTDFNKVRWNSEEFMGKYVPTVPLGRIGDVQDIKGAVLFLASPASAYLSGHALILDGGRQA
jgi:NAD(P)-dependent dehydrogenase (short-subunit alcohol dehydrogenase family)